MSSAVEFACPTCHRARLESGSDGLTCHACGQRYPVVDGVPVLINDSNSVFAISDYLGRGGYQGAAYGTTVERERGLRRLYRRAAHWLSEFSIRISDTDSRSVLAALCRERARPPKVLVIGAGTARYDQLAEIVYTDVAFSPGLHAIADGHDLPFEDGTFDLVLAVAVLEHVADPQRVVAEMWRVLRPDGQVYAATPFLQPVHMGAYDFTRFTPLGHRRLFRRFDEIASGLAVGPAAVLAWSLRMLLTSMVRGRTWRAATGFAALVLSVPLKLLDHATKRNVAALDGAGGVWFHGRKRETPISDREMIRFYRGGFR